MKRVRVLARYAIARSSNDGVVTLVICSICGNDEFQDRKILWPSLIADWEISPDEVAYIDRQQGTSCTRCGANLRGVALGYAICDVVGSAEPLQAFIKTRRAQELSILDLNGTSVSDTLSGLPNYIRADYPTVDMQAMPYRNAEFDLVIHSDTLEHVPRPLDGLRECRRVLAPSGRLCYTVPIIVGRMTRSREGLPPSYHGNPEEEGYDFVVQTEYGADAWTHPILAGFSSVKVNTISYPAATALTAW
jgi:SAM-dependent methyltransferase